MSAPEQPTTLKLRAQNISVDGTRILPKETSAPQEVASGAALAALRAYAAMPPVDLVGADVRLYLAGPHESIAVQNDRGRLLVAQTPEIMNTWVECAPEQIIARLLPTDPVAQAAEASRQAAAHAPVHRHRTPRFHLLVGSPWKLGVVALVAVVVAWQTFSPAVPQGLTLVRHPDQVAQLEAQFMGRYGAGREPGQIYLLVGGGKCRGYQTGATADTDKLLFESAYRFARRPDGVAVLLLANGATFEPRPGGGLVFLSRTYARLNNP